MKRFKKLPSPALVLAGIALVAALAGTAVALPGKNVIDKNDIGKNDVKVGDISKGVVDSSDVKNEVLKEEDLGPSAKSPRAYALVTADANVTEANSRVITDGMVSLEGSTYCITGVPFVPRFVEATVNNVGSQADIIIQASINPPDDSSGCAGAEQVSVTLFDVSASGLVTGPDFFIALHD